MIQIAKIESLDFVKDLADQVKKKYKLEIQQDKEYILFLKNRIKQKEKWLNSYSNFQHREEYKVSHY